jgi:hypothetical protein
MTTRPALTIAATLFAIATSSLSSAALLTVATLRAIPNDAHAKSATAQAANTIALHEIPVFAPGERDAFAIDPNRDLIAFARFHAVI